jgi:hypothetical protein
MRKARGPGAHDRIPRCRCRSLRRSLSSWTMGAVPSMIAVERCSRNSARRETTSEPDSERAATHRAYERPYESMLRRRSRRASRLLERACSVRRGTRRKHVRLSVGFDPECVQESSRIRIARAVPIARGFLTEFVHGPERRTRPRNWSWEQGSALLLRRNGIDGSECPSDHDTGVEADGAYTTSFVQNTFRNVRAVCGARRAVRRLAAQSQPSAVAFGPTGILRELRHGKQREARRRDHG